MQILLIFLIFVEYQSISVKDLYCGQKNCFEILGLDKNSSSQEIKKAFREKSKLYHPDKAPGLGLDPNVIYTDIVQAYEILSEDEKREAYLDFLKNPDSGQAYHYYRYYHGVYRTYNPQSNPYIVVACIILALSTIQYSARYGMHQHAVKQACGTSHFKRHLNDRFKEDQDQDYEKLRSQLESEIKINGAYSKPVFSDLWFIVILNFVFLKIIFDTYFALKWWFKYQYKKDEVQKKDAQIKTQKLLSLNDYKWNSLSIDEREDLVLRELWIQENMQLYQQEQKEIYQEYVMKHSNKFKQQKRWLKKQN